MMTDHGARVERLDFERALRTLRSFLPETLDVGDPTPFRRTIYGVHVDKVTGRRAEQRVRKSGRQPLPRSGARRQRPRTPDGF
jgi:hypothetical protein